MMTKQVNRSWEIWRYSRALNPDEKHWKIPISCCESDSDCNVYSYNITNIYMKDCYIEVKEFVSKKSNSMGSVALIVACIQVKFIFFA